MNQIHTKYSDTLSFKDIVKVARKFDFSSLLLEPHKSLGLKCYMCRWYMDGEEYSPKKLTTGTLKKIKDINSLKFIISCENKEETFTAEDFDNINSHMKY